ncbi:MAG: transglutaminase domain-containing protein [Methanobacteriaceae archaeon]
MSGVFGADSFDDVQSLIDNDVGDVVNLGNKTYVGSGEHIVINKSNIVIRGQSGSSKAVLDADFKSRVLYITCRNVTLENLILSNGDSDSWGGAIRAGGSELSVSNCEFRNNRAAGGAVIISDDANNALFSYCVFVNNSACVDTGSGGTGGGAVDSHASNTRFVGCSFINNSGVSLGGALYFIIGSNNSIVNCVFDSNFAPRGGAICVGDSVTSLSVVSSVFLNNSATDSTGGGVYSAGLLNVSNCSFSGNRAVGNGGGVYSASATVINRGSIFNDNDAVNGGAVFASAGVTISNSSFVNNRASSNGGALYSSYSTVNIGNNSFFTGNNASNGGGIYSSASVTVSNTNFNNNRATGTTGGGAVFISSPSLNVVSCSFTGNNASNGGAIRTSVSANIRGSTFSFNKATGSGGAVYTDNTLTLSNSNFYDNLAVNGGGIFSSKTLTLTSVNGTRNNASSGGFIYAKGAVTISSGTYTNNKATGSGGAIFGTSVLSFVSSNFTGNRAVNGGAILGTSTLTVDNGSFSSNVASGSGGAVYTNGLITIKNGASFVYNSATSGSGGAVYSTSSLIVDKGSFSSNTAKGSGGAVYAKSATIKNGASFVYNSATSGSGGAVYGSGVLSLVSSNFVSNRAVYGGAILGTSTLTVDKGSFSSNTATGSGGALYGTGIITIKNGATFNSNVASGSGGAVFSTNSLNVGSSSSFSGNRAVNGGALYSSSKLTVDKGSFSSNTATGSGGAVYAKTATIKNGAKFSSNSAVNGGAIYSYGALSITGNSKLNKNNANKGSAIYTNSKLDIAKTVFEDNKVGLILSISLDGNVVKYNKTKVNVRAESYNNVYAKNAMHSIWAKSIGNVKVDGKSVKKYVASGFIVKVNNENVRIESGKGSTNIKTLALTYNWKDFTFKASYAGSKIFAKASSTYRVSAKIASTDVYNVDMGKNSKYYVPHRTDNLQTKINGKIYSKTIKMQKASNNAYLLGGEEISDDLQKLLSGWDGVSDVNEPSIKNKLTVIFALKSKAYSIEGKLTPMEKTRSILKWVSSNIKYNYNADFGGAIILKKGYGNCAGYTNLFVSLIRTAGVPSSYLYFEPNGYDDPHVISLVYIKKGDSYIVYRIEPQRYSFNYDGWKPSKMENDGGVNFDVYGEEIIFPHWYYKYPPIKNQIKYLSLYDYWNPTYKKNAFVILK